MAFGGLFMSRERNCGTCYDNDNKLCDRTGFIVEDDDTCEHWREQTWRERMMDVFLAGH